ncbi:MAG: hypothetical protein A3F84_28760 [Candidatus Handelsmanbacteria bacterium RIFCSPLOWO2_12_FULL_64_10]|uniref:Staphylococcus aureus surface protein A n=1 Tax=Handelsmanbacteria sp. (strain RIFCSPLOWO2_12_FULL_64_10) TaxID=1817868 RepID=A0A1F6C6E9_HANXR|nr:MAG: hypothetical protein A3F84_28760 [Candidatus Handelsmanbacteria bacterium RIFCSPLOWO2_12_FULL_64_10]
MSAKHPLSLISLAVLTLTLGLTGLTSAQVEEAWVARYNGPANGHDRARSLSVDGSGNVYVTGGSYNGSNGDYLTVKYDVDGNQVWERRYNGPANSQEQARALSVDGSGNVYVTGTSHNGSNNDYLTLKYNSGGNLVWERRYNGPANRDDLASSLSVDGSGNVYVTGESGNASNSDYLTLKYDSAGNLAWERRYNGAANNNDGAYALSIDGSGNVYVTGGSWNGSNFDYLTLKYDSAGNLAWERRYNGPANSHELAKSLSVDGSGNVYVTGESENASNSDYLTLKYDSGGNLVWERRYNGPTNNFDSAHALSVDGNGNVYVTGSSDNGSNFDYLTLKYDSGGNLVWERRYNGSANNRDEAYTLSVDGSGNVYVTGSSNNGNNPDYLTLKYDSGGNLVWERRYNGPANSADIMGQLGKHLQVDASGNVYVTGGSHNGINEDYATVKYSQQPVPAYAQSASSLSFGSINVGSSGTQTFTVSNTGTGALTVSGITVVGADAGQFSVSPSTGFTINAGGPAQTVTVTFTPTSDGVKSASLSVAHNAAGSPAAVSLSGTGAGPIYAIDAPRDIATVAGNGTSGYSGDGGAATSASLFAPIGAAVDGAGNLYIVDQNNHCIRKVSTSGVITTVAGNGTPGYSGDGGAATSASLNYPYGVAVDGSGALYIGDQNNHRIRKVSASGMITTVAGNGTAGYSGDGGAATSASLNYPYGVAVDGSGVLYIADRSNHRIRKVSTSGVITTVAGNGMPGYSGDGGAATFASLNLPSSVSVDGSGALYIMDRSNHRIRKVSASGVITTVAGNGTAGYSGDGGAAASASLNFPSGVFVDESGVLYVADQHNQRIRKVSASGEITTVAGNGTAGYSGDGGAATSASLFYPTGVAVDGSGNLYIADHSRVWKAKPALLFGSVAVGSPNAQTFAISNPAAVALNVTGITVTGADAGQFSVSPTSFTINPGDPAQTVTVTFTPSSAGSKSASLSVAHNAAGSPATVTLSGTGNVPVQPPSGLVSWWKGDGNAQDSRGSNHGALLNGAAFSSGEVGQAFSFDGVNDYVEAPDSPLWTFGGDFTIDLWANWASLPPPGSPHGSIFIGHDNGGGTQPKWFFSYSNATLGFHINGPAGSGFLAQSPFTPQPGQWYNLAIRRSGSTYAVFVDGQVIGSQVSSLAIPDATAPLTIGQAEGIGFFNGRLDEVAIFHQALSNQDISAIWGAGAAGMTPNQPPVATNDAATTNEDTAADIAVRANDSDPDGDALTVTAVTQGTNGSVAINPDGTVKYTPNADFHGSDSFTYTISDGKGETATATVTVTVNPVNDVPSFTKGADQTALEDAGAQAVSNWATDLSTGPASESGQALSFEVTNDNNGLFSAQPAVDASGKLTYTPAANANGSATVTVTLKDDGGTANGGQDASPAQTFTITVTPVNDAPSFAKGPDQTVNEDAGAQTVANWATAISAGPADEAGQTLVFQVTNDNNALFSAQPAISPSGELTYAPGPDAHGSATVTVALKDDGGTANGGVDTSPAQTFTITVTPVNDVPVFTKGADQTVLEDAGAQSVSGWGTAISAGPADESGQSVNFIVSNDNNALFSAQPAISPTGDLTYTPAANANGNATVTVTLKDNGGVANGGVDASAQQTFTINVTPVNDAPSFVKGADQTILEDAGPQSVAAWAMNISAGPANESGQTVDFIVGNDNNALFSSQPAVDASGNLTYTPAPDAYGIATVTVQAHDNGGTASGGSDTSPAQMFVIHVTPVNDAPSFTRGADQTAYSDAGPQTAVNWATDLSAGPPNESSQSLSFIVSNDNNALFSSQPAVDPTGTLTFTPAGNACGIATVTVVLRDNGGTANGGVDVSAPQTFTITVLDRLPPTITLTQLLTELWPPNHKMYKVATVSVVDNCDPSPVVTVTVTSNEPINGQGDGNTTRDWEVVSNENGTYEVFVRSERSGKGTGRVYTITVTARDASGNEATSKGTVTVRHDQWKKAKVGLALVGEEAPQVPEAFGLEQSYPNPFNPATTIRYALPEASNVSLVVYNILGQQVRVLVNGAQGPGYHTAVWDGRDEAGRMAATGVYIYRLQAGAFSQIRKMILAK